MTSTAVPGIPDYMMSIVASHKYDKHSFEVGAFSLPCFRLVLLPTTHLDLVRNFE